MLGKLKGNLKDAEAVAKASISEKKVKPKGRKLGKTETKVKKAKRK